MMDILSVENMRASDAKTISEGTSGRELMFRAGSRIFDSVDWKPPVGVLCGSGNNAGDGYVISLLLQKAGIPCEIILLSDHFTADGRYYFEQCREAGIRIVPWENDLPLQDFSTLVDCIWGTGFHGIPAGNEREAIIRINESGAYVVSVDINSGLNGDSGQAELCVQSDLTVSVGSFQPGHFLGRAKDVMKRKINCDIGIAPAAAPFHLIEPSDLKKVFSPRLNNSHKGTYGYCTLIGGSVRYSGAIRLASMANAAMRSGAGVVRAALPRSLYHDLLPLILESTVFPLSDRDGELLFREAEIAEAIAGTRAVAFGMGAGISEEGRKLLSFLLDSYSGRLIVDADGLTMLAGFPRLRLRNCGGPLILTPHVKEFSRLSGLEIPKILEAPVESARSYAAETGAIVLLKGPTTVITDGTTTYLSDTGCPGMATAGSGDVLSGILTAVEAGPAEPLLGTAAAAYLNGLAGELAQKHFGAVSMIAGDTVSFIPEAVRQLSAEKQV